MTCVFKAIVAATFLLIVCTASSSRATSEVDALRIRDAIRQAFLAEDFARLDAMIDEYQRTDARIQSGTPKMAQVYATLGDNEQLFGVQSYESLEKMQRLAEEWVKERPTSRAARLTVVAAMVDVGWFVRGNGSALSLSKEQWAGFRQSLGQADAYLRFYKTSLSLDPEWYVLMMHIQMNFTDQNGFKQYADEALARFPHYYPIHWSIMDEVQPQWGGTVEWAKYWLDRIDHVNSPASYTWAYWYLFDKGYPHMFPEDWPRMKAGLEEIVAAYPTRGNLNTYGLFACVANDMPKLRELFGRIGNDVDFDAWKDRGTAGYCRELTYASPSARAGPLAEWYLVEAYKRRSGDGPLDIVFGPVDLADEGTAISKAHELLPAYDGVQVFKLTPDPTKREYQRPVVLFNGGSVPNRLR